MDGQWIYGLGSRLDEIASGVGSIIPELILVLGFALALLAELAWGKKYKSLVPGIGLVAVVLAMALEVVLIERGENFWLKVFEGRKFLGMIQVDGFGRYFHLLFDLTAGLTILVSMRSRQLRNEARGLGEYFVVLLAMLIGMHFMSMASNLMMMYLALEMVSLPSYVLTAYARLNGKSAEAALKYVIYGSFSSGIMLYGISWIYGITGTLDPTAPEFVTAITAQDPWVVLFLVTMVLAGFLFKISSLPFHFWAPDVYEGASYPVAAFFSVAPKAAGFAMLMRFMAIFPMAPETAELLTAVILVLAIASMTLGNLSALRQENFRRMLAYSSIAQAGYMLVGLACFSVLGYGAVIFYLTIYVAMNYSAFLLAGWMDEEMGLQKIEDMRGLAQGIPVLAILLTLFMVSLTGLPPTAGFIAKLEIFLAALEQFQASGSSMLIVAMIALLVNTVISLFYYLRVPSKMIFQNSPNKTFPGFRGWIPLTAMVLAIPVLWWGILHFDVLIGFFQSLATDLNG